MGEADFRDRLQAYLPLGVTARVIVDGDRVSLGLERDNLTARVRMRTDNFDKEVNGAVEFLLQRLDATCR